MTDRSLFSVTPKLSGRKRRLRSCPCNRSRQDGGLHWDGNGTMPIDSVARAPGETLRRNPGHRTRNPSRAKPATGIVRLDEGGSRQATGAGKVQIRQPIRSTAENSTRTKQSAATLHPQTRKQKATARPVRNQAALPRRIRSHAGRAVIAVAPRVRRRYSHSMVAGGLEEMS